MRDASWAGGQSPLLSHLAYGKVLTETASGGCSKRRRMVPDPRVPEMGGSSPRWSVGRGDPRLQTGFAETGLAGDAVNPAVAGAEVAASKPFYAALTRSRSRLIGKGQNKS